MQRQKLDEDVERIIALYNDYGLHPGPGGVRRHPGRPGERASVTITISWWRGRSSGSGQVTLTGITLLPEEEVQRQLKFKHRRCLLPHPAARHRRGHHGPVLHHRPRLRRRDPAHRPGRTAQPHGNITFDISEGPEVYVERINISGNPGARTRSSAGSSPWPEGELFTLQKLQRARQRLVNLGYFETVIATTAARLRPRTKIIVNIEVTEKPTGLFSIGGGLLLAGQLHRHGRPLPAELPGPGLRAVAPAAGRLHQPAGAPSASPTRGCSTCPSSGGFDLFKTRRVFTDYTLDSTGAGLRVSKPFLEYWRWFAGYSLREDKISNIEGIASTFALQEEGRTVTSVIDVGLARTAGTTSAPTRGGLQPRRWTSRAWAAIPIREDDRLHHLLLSDLAQPHRVRPAGGRLGLAAWSSEPLPLFERFYLGGPNPSASFKFRQVSPVDEFGTEIGGNGEVLGNAEYIVPLPFNFRVAAFFDVGNVYGFTDAVRHHRPAVRRRRRHLVAIALRADPGGLWRQPRSPERVITFGEVQFSIGRAFLRRAVMKLWVSAVVVAIVLTLCAASTRCPGPGAAPAPAAAAATPAPDGLQRIAYIDLQRVLARSAAGVAAREQLERDKGGDAERDGRKRTRSWRSCVTRWKRRAPLMTADARAREAGAVRAQAARRHPPG